MNTKTKERTASLNMRCTEATKLALEYLAERQGKTMSDVVDHLIKDEYHRVLYAEQKRAVE